MSVVCYGRGDRVPEGYIKVNTTSRSADFGRAFSPFLLGPCQVNLMGTPIEAKIMENAWQYSKLYSCHEHSPDYFMAWAQRGMSMSRPMRFPMGRGAKPLYSIKGDAKLGYIQARIEIYAPAYESCVLRDCKTELKRLQDMYRQGKDIALFDYDGHNHNLAGLTLEDVLYNKRRKMGHSFILAGLITGNRFWDTAYDASKEHSTSVPRWSDKKK